MSEFDIVIPIAKSIGTTLTAQTVFTLAGLSLATAGFSWNVFSNIADRLHRLEDEIIGEIQSQGGGADAFRSLGTTIFGRVANYRGVGNNTPRYVNLRRQVEGFIWVQEGSIAPRRFVVAFVIFVVIGIISLAIDPNEVENGVPNVYAAIDGAGLGPAFFTGLGILISGARLLFIAMRNMLANL